MPTSHRAPHPTDSTSASQPTTVAADLARRLRTRSARVAVMGLGYAGLPMAVEITRAGFTVVGLDVAEERVRLVNSGRSPMSDVADRDIAAMVDAAVLCASTDFDLLAEVDCVLICVPTPLNSCHQPDLQFVEAAARSIAARLHPGLLVILQSTCTPGTTRKVILPLLQDGTELRVGVDYFVAFAPERIDPGNRHYAVHNTPKLVGGVTERCSELAGLFYGPIVQRIVMVSSPEVAEMSKLLENTFRFINISFANEMAMLCDRMGISIWEVIEAASTKPFAFMPHYPGPGVGGHCIPIVPFYLEAAEREHGMTSELVHAAGTINETMPRFVVAKLLRILAEQGKQPETARVLLLGVAYKPDVSDTRESAALRVLQLLRERGVCVSYYDPHVPRVQCCDAEIDSLSAREIESNHFDCAVLLAAHAAVDYRNVLSRVAVVLDTHNFLTDLEGTSVARL